MSPQAINYSNFGPRCFLKFLERGTANEVLFLILNIDGWARLGIGDQWGNMCWGLSLPKQFDQRLPDVSWWSDFCSAIICGGCGKRGTQPPKEKSLKKDLRSSKRSNFLFLSGFQCSLENKAVVVPGHGKYLDGRELILIGHRAGMTDSDMALCIPTLNGLKLFGQIKAKFWKLC